MINSIAEWIKVDLHFHTHISNSTKGDYPNNYNETEIITKLNEYDVKLVAITDHNKFDTNNFNNLIAKSNGTIVFLPGVELKVDGYDVIMIIDPDFTIKNKNEELKTIDFFDKKILEFCKNDRAVGQNTTDELVRIFKDFNYIIIPEYNRGNGGDKATRNDDSASTHFRLQLLSGFYSAADIKNEKNKNTGKNTIDYFKEMFQYANTSLDANCIYVSDNHNINVYPNKSLEQNNTFRGWTYMHSLPTFDGLKFAFTDPNSRFFITEELTGKPTFNEGRKEFIISKFYIRNNESKIINEINISPHLNAIIGPHSSGKTYLFKKLYSKFDINKEKEYKEEYKDLWDRYSLKICFLNGYEIDYEKYDNSKNKVTFLEQNHVIKDIEDTGQLYRDWYSVINITEPIKQTEEITIQKKKINEDIKLYFENILELRDSLPKLHKECDIFEFIGPTASDDMTQIYAAINLNIGKYETDYKNDKTKLSLILLSLQNISFINLFISQINKEIMTTNIEANITLLKKIIKYTERINLGMTLVKKYCNNILDSLTEKTTAHNNMLREIARLKNIYFQVGKKIKNILTLKKKLWDSKKHSYNTIKTILPFSSSPDGSKWTFEDNVVLILNNDSVKNALSKLFLQPVSSLEGKYNPTNNLGQFCLAPENQLYKASYSKEKFNQLEFYKEINEQDIKDEGASYINNSPGGKANIILKILLENDNLKNRILLIDQPEDSLDNRTIATWLVGALRRLKFTNQVFVVTHDANIAVNGDAQNIIIPELNSTIFEESIQILEGGKIEMHKRMNKWNNTIFEEVNIHEIKSKMTARK